MKGFPMAKGTGSYLKEASAMKMKKEAMKMKKESMAKQAKPDFPDIDGDGNTTESMKAAASAAKQKYDKSDTDERVYDLNQKKYDKFRSTQGKKFPDIRYLGKKENKKFLEEYLKRKDNKIVSKSISRSDENSPAPQKTSYKEAFEYMEKGDNSDKKKTRKAKRTVRKSIRKGEMMKGEAFPGHFNQAPKSMYREGTEENKKMKKSSAAPQKENPAITKYNKAVKSAKDEYKSFIGKLHSEGRADTTGYSKTGGVKGLTKVDLKAVKEAQKARNKKIKAAEKQAKKDGLTKAK